MSTLQENVRTYEDGECIFREGDETKHMFVVQAGEVIVSKTGPDGKDDKVVLATLKRGDFLGEMSLLESLPRHADAHAKGKTRLLIIQPGGFLLKIRRDPTFAFELLQALSKRIRVTNEKLLARVSGVGVAGGALEKEIKKILSEDGV